ncbi:hypothetical protein MKW94_009803, partial [Papaver nudicaule]|nr:hypothetical protein [Papaver nudicaule]
SCRTTPARQITLPEPKINSVIDLSVPDNSKTISELLESKWDPKDPVYFTIHNNGWYYLGCNKCPTKVVGEEGNYGCTKCENKVEEPIPRYLLRFQVTDDSETTIFAVLDSEVHRIVCASASAMLMLGEVKLLFLDHCLNRCTFQE